MSDLDRRKLLAAIRRLEVQLNLLELYFTRCLDPDGERREAVRLVELHTELAELYGELVPRNPSDWRNG
jgi:hypothetical protein